MGHGARPEGARPSEGAPHARSDREEPEPSVRVRGVGVGRDRSLSEHAHGRWPATSALVAAREVRRLVSPPRDTTGLQSKPGVHVVESGRGTSSLFRAQLRAAHTSVVARLPPVSRGHLDMPDSGAGPSRRPLRQCRRTAPSSSAGVHSRGSSERMQVPPNDRYLTEAFGYQTSPGRHAQLMAASRDSSPELGVRNTMIQPSSSGVETGPSSVRTELAPRQRSQPSRS